MDTSIFDRIRTADQGGALPDTSLHDNTALTTAIMAIIFAGGRTILDVAKWVAKWVDHWRSDDRDRDERDRLVVLEVRVDTIDSKVDAVDGKVTRLLELFLPTRAEDHKRRLPEVE